MKFVIEYYEIMSDHLLATPEFHHKEIVDAKNDKALDNYIAQQKDFYGNHYVKKANYGFTHISNQGALKVYPYKPPKVKKI